MTKKNSKKNLVEKEFKKTEHNGKKELAAAATIWLLTLGKNRGLVRRHQN